GRGTGSRDLRDEVDPPASFASRALGRLQEANDLEALGTSCFRGATGTAALDEMVRHDPKPFGLIYLRNPDISRAPVGERDEISANDLVLPGDAAAVQLQLLVDRRVIEHNGLLGPRDEHP